MILWHDFALKVPHARNRAQIWLYGIVIVGLHRKRESIGDWVSLDSKHRLRDWGRTLCLLPCLLSIYGAAPVESFFNRVHATLPPWTLDDD